MNIAKCEYTGAKPAVSFFQRSKVGFSGGAIRKWEYFVSQVIFKFALLYENVCREKYLESADRI